MVKPPAGETSHLLIILDSLTAHTVPVPGLQEEFSDWLAASKPLPSHLLRFMCHLLLFLRSLGLALKVTGQRLLGIFTHKQVVTHFPHLVLSQNEVCVDVLKAYVSLLIGDQQTNLVASYVSQLPADVAVSQYAAFLETVTEAETRPRCLQLATDAGGCDPVQMMARTGTTAHGILNVCLCSCRPGRCCHHQTGGGDCEREG